MDRLCRWLKALVTNSSTVKTPHPHPQTPLPPTGHIRTPDNMSRLRWLLMNNKRRYMVYTVLALTILLFLGQSYVHRQEGLLGCVTVAIVPEDEWKLFDLRREVEEVTGSTARPPNFDAILTAYANFHSRTSAVLSESLPSPVLLYSNNRNGFGNRQLAVAWMLIYSMMTSRVFFHDWSEPFDSSLYYSRSAHPLLGLIDYPTRRSFVNSLGKQRRVAFTWRACDQGPYLSEFLDDALAAERGGKNVVFYDGWTCGIAFSSLLEKLKDDANPRSEMMRKNMATLKEWFDFTGRSDFGFGWFLPYFMQPSPVISGLVKEISKGFRKGDVKMCIAVRAGPKANPTIQRGKKNVVTTYTECPQRYIDSITATGKQVSVYILGDDPGVRRAIETKLSATAKTFTSGVYPVHIAEDSLGMIRKFSDCEFERGSLLTAAEQFVLRSCDISFGSITSTFHFSTFYSALADPKLHILQHLHTTDAWGEWTTQTRQREYPSMNVSVSPYPGNLCDGL